MLEPPLRRPDQEPLLNPMPDFVAASNGNASPNRGLLGYGWGAPHLTRVYNSVNCKYALTAGYRLQHCVYNVLKSASDSARRCAEVTHSCECSSKSANPASPAANRTNSEAGGSRPALHSGFAGSEASASKPVTLTPIGDSVRLGLPERNVLSGHRQYPIWEEEKAWPSTI